jgi:hypothetical protein
MVSLHQARRVLQPIISGDSARTASWLPPAAAMGSQHEDIMKKLLKTFLVVIAMSMVSGSARSRSLQITGTAGYLSEWELSGAVTERASSGSGEFSGSLIWKHIGLCSVNSPQEKSGDIRFQLSGFGAWSRINAVISLDGAQCDYSGEFSGSSHGHMDCSDVKGVPLSISIK